MERKSFQVADGFEVNLFAADPLLAKPIQMNFDPAGRLWVACSEAYPQIKPGAKANDKIIILEDTNGDGKADKTTVFADGLLIPTGVDAGRRRRLRRRQHRPASSLGHRTATARRTERGVVLSGFGTEDTHHIVHTLRWGPDGMLYFNQSIYIHSHIETPHGVRRLNGGGIWQFRPETRELEVFCAACGIRGAITSTAGAIVRHRRRRRRGHQLRLPRRLPSPRPSACRASCKGLNPGRPKYCGLEILSGRHLPDDWHGNLITNDFRGHRVCRFVVDAGRLRLHVAKRCPN